MELRRFAVHKCAKEGNHLVHIMSTDSEHKARRLAKNLARCHPPLSFCVIDRQTVLVEAQTAYTRMPLDVGFEIAAETL